MKRNVFLLVIFLLFFLITPFVLGSVRAATLKFDKTSVNVTVGGTVDVAVIVDAGSDQISSTDAYVLFDPTLLEVSSVASGTAFPVVTNNISSGKVYVAGLNEDTSKFVTGTSTLATITFKGLANGTGTLTFECQASGETSKTVKTDLNATNVISCADNGTAAVSVGTGGGSSSSTSANLATPSALPRTGIFDNVKNLAIPGAMLFLMGGLLRFVL